MKQHSPRSQRTGSIQVVTREPSELMDPNKPNRANSKYYNPYAFDPLENEYQEDIRMRNFRDLPSELHLSDGKRPS